MNYDLGTAKWTWQWVIGFRCIACYVTRKETPCNELLATIIEGLMALDMNTNGFQGQKRNVLMMH